MLHLIYKLFFIIPDFIISFDAKPSEIPQESGFSSMIPFIRPLDEFEVSSSGRKYSNDSLGLYIEIPEEAVPEGSLLRLEVGMCLYGPFKFPKDMYPIAPILMLCSKSDIKLHRSVNITVPHIIADAKHTDIETHGIQVIKADHTSLLIAGECIFDNVIQDSNLSFKTYKGFGLATFSLPHFSFVSIFEKRDNIEIAKERGYCICPLLPSPSAYSSATLTFYLCVTYFMQPCLEVSIQYIQKHGTTLYCIKGRLSFKILQTKLL